MSELKTETEGSTEFEFVELFYCTVVVILLLPPRTSTPLLLRSRVLAAPLRFGAVSRAAVSSGCCEKCSSSTNPPLTHTYAARVKYSAHLHGRTSFLEFLRLLLLWGFSLSLSSSSLISHLIGELQREDILCWWADCVSVCVCVCAMHLQYCDIKSCQVWNCVIVRVMVVKYDV